MSTKNMGICKSVYFLDRFKGDVHLEAILAPLWDQKVKVALHKFLLISLLEQ